jgi:hypothetical protein
VQHKWSKREYNDQLQFEMTASFRKDQLAFFNKYQTALDEIKEANLTLKKNSYEIIKGKLKGKELLQQPTNLMPIHQFWEPTNHGAIRRRNQCATI